MTRSQRRSRSEALIQHYAERFRRELGHNLAYDIRKEIDKEKDARKRGAMLAAERTVYREMHIGHGDCPNGPLDRSDIEVEAANKGHAFDELWGLK